MAADKLVTAGSLVVELDRLGVGSWDKATVRKWILEEPPCPIAERRRPGQSHLYRVADVIRWHAERSERAGRRFAGPEIDRDSPAGAAADEALAVAESRFSESEMVQRLLEVIEGRDPRNWKAAEEAMAMRLKRLEMQGDLVKASELKDCLMAQQLGFRSALRLLAAQLKVVVRSSPDPTEIDQVIDHEVMTVLERLADAVVLEADRQAA